MENQVVFEDAAVVGSGLMGLGIAVTMAMNGVSVSINDISEDILAGARSNLDSILTDLENKGIISDREELNSKILFKVDLKDAVSSVDIIFEAITENAEAKRELFAKAAGYADKNTVLASNTSVIKIGDLASGTGHRNRLLGIHWMNPPYATSLVEVIPSEWTDPGITDSVCSFLETMIGKVVVKSPDVPGFIVNRFNAIVGSAAAKLIDEGTSPEDVDKVWKYHLGLLYTAFGPLGNMDYIGLDVAYLASLYLSTKLENGGFYVPEWLVEKVDRKELGVKSGKGIYDYGKETPEALYAKRAEFLRRNLEWLKEQR